MKYAPYKEGYKKCMQLLIILKSVRAYEENNNTVSPIRRFESRNQNKKNKPNGISNKFLRGKTNNFQSTVLNCASSVGYAQWS